MRPVKREQRHNLPETRLDAGTLATQAAEMAAMLMVGDGALALAQPRRHVGLWYGWSRTVDRALDRFMQRPGWTRLVGAAEVVAGLTLASQLKRNGRDRVQYT